MPGQGPFCKAESPSGSSESSHDDALVAEVRRPVTRRGHFKSRLGCFNCKKRRVKCNEQRPLCAPCQRLGLRCQYPPRDNQVSLTQQQPTSTGLGLEDLRFHFQFLTVAFPSLPLRGADVWTQCASMIHSVRHYALCERNLQ